MYWKKRIPSHFPSLVLSAMYDAETPKFRSIFSVHYRIKSNIVVFINKQLQANISAMEINSKINNGWLKTFHIEQIGQKNKEGFNLLTKTMLILLCCIMALKF